MVLTIQLTILFITLIQNHRNNHSFFRLIWQVFFIYSEVSHVHIVTDTNCNTVPFAQAGKRGCPARLSYRVRGRIYCPRAVWWKGGVPRLSRCVPSSAPRAMPGSALRSRYRGHLSPRRE